MQNLATAIMLQVQWQIVSQSDHAAFRDITKEMLIKSLCENGRIVRYMGLFV